ncbi:aldolase/citrate lyase family protein [Microbispora corallina]|uniref:Aldolase n=1 Tax=Microbispora corallina TaxID=83302 RepID=A0ABQ4FSI5_9ACTN|nr:aldolase [Microbispora corallina]GIH37781.1 aldolase [Microbispora corallina]
METTLTGLDGLLDGFAETHREQQERFPAPEPAWQPVHTVYVPADRVTSAVVGEWRHEATELLHRLYFTPAELAAAFGLDPLLAAPVHDRVRRKLGVEPIEDLRIDFEDGYGARPSEEEDRHAESAAAAVAAMHADGTLPRRWGLRVKSFADGDPRRSIRTLDGFLTEVMRRSGGLPAGFVVTFPKVLMEDYLRQFARCLEALESTLRLDAGTLRFEMQVEAPQTVLMLQRSPDLVASLGGRLAAAHFGVFDYTASLGLPPGEQRLDHPACDHARHVMQTALAGTGVELSDGSLAAAPASESADDVQALLQRHSQTVSHSLSNGFYQGWDMHPSHLVSRFTTVYAFHLECYERYLERVRAWEERRAASGGLLDEPATVKTLIAAIARADRALC